MTAPQPLTMADPLWRPSTKAPRLWAITASLFWVPVIVAEIVCAVLVPGIPSWVVGTVFAVTVLFAATYILMVPAWRHRVHRWEISDTAVYTRTGCSPRSDASHRSRACRPWTPSADRSTACWVWQPSRSRQRRRPGP